jgi:hypothetical protein
MTITAPAPIEARPPRSPLAIWTIALVVAVAIAGAILGAAYWETRTPVAVPPVVDAGPLHAHLVNGVAVCDDSTAAVWSDAKQGVAGQVNMQGPGVVIVSVVGNGRVRRIQQQVTARDSIVTWDLPLTAPATSVTVLVRAGGSVGMCQVAAPVYPGLTRSNPLVGTVG